MDFFWGIEVQRQNDGSLILTQSKYIRDLLAKTKMDESNPISSPMVGGCKLTKFCSEEFSNPTLYRSIVGALQYATITRPEISFSVNKVCQFMSKPSEQHWLAAKRILRYLISTVSWGLHFPDDRKSTSGAAIFLGPNLISLWSKKQSVVDNLVS